MRLTSIDIPNSVTTISEGTFASVCNMTSVKIPSSITAIDGWAFFDCTSLTEIYSLATTPPAVGDNCFLNAPTSTCTLKVPAEAVEIYKTAEGWRDFGTIVGLTDDELEALGVENLTQNPKLNTQNLFNLQGQEVGEDYKGIVIRGGKKYMRR